MNQTLEVDSVILEFGNKRVLQDVYLKNQINEITGILGRNGAGKSCLLSIIYGKLKPLNGLLRINNKAIMGSTRRPKELMYLPQFGFIPKFLTLKRIFKDFKLDFATFTKEFPEFEPYFNSKLSLLSGGERRIVEIYLIISSKTKFCLLDEPFSHIMPIHIEKIKALLLKEKANKGILVTDHMYEDIVGISDDIYLIKDGKTFLINHLDDIKSLGYVKLSPDYNLSE